MIGDMYICILFPHVDISFFLSTIYYWRSIALDLFYSQSKKLLCLFKKKKNKKKKKLTVDTAVCSFSRFLSSLKKFVVSAVRISLVSLAREYGIVRTSVTRRGDCDGVCLRRRSSQYSFNNPYQHLSSL